MFMLWNAFQAEASTLSFDVTRANMPRIAQPDERWVAAACAALGAKRRPSDWRISALRSSYFSDEPEAGAPEDRWRECWTIDVRLDGADSVGGGCGGIGVGLDDLDPSWAGDRDPGHDERALIMAVGDRGQAESALAEAATTAERAGLEAPPGAAIPCAGGAVAIRLLVPCTFPRDVEALEAITTHLDGGGWATNWRSALWTTRPENGEPPA